MRKSTGMRSGSPEGARRASGGDPDRSTSDRGRFSVRRKAEAVIKLLRGQSLEALSRELGVTAAALSKWREQFLAGGQGSLKSRPEDDRDEEIRRLRAKIGEIMMDNELLLERCHRVEEEKPFLRPRWRR